MKIKPITCPNDAHSSERYKWTGKSAVTSSLHGVSLKISEVLQRLHPLSLWYRLYRAFFSATYSSGNFLIFFQIFSFHVISKARRLQKHILGHSKMGEACMSPKQSYSFPQLPTTYVHDKRKGQEGEGEKGIWRGCFLIRSKHCTYKGKKTFINVMNAKARQFSLANCHWFLQFTRPSNGSKVPTQPAEEWKAA